MCKYHCWHLDSYLPHNGRLHETESKRVYCCFCGIDKVEHRYVGTEHGEYKEKFEKYDGE